MARLLDLQNLLESSGGLPKGRIRSLIMQGRKVGLFTSEGKGRRPRIVGRDAAHGLLFVLRGDGVANSVEAAQALAALPLWTIKMDDGTGWGGPVPSSEFFAKAPADDLPPALWKLELAETLGAALGALFDDGGGTVASHRFNAGDELEICHIRDACRVDLLLGDYGAGHPAQPARWWRLRFMHPADEGPLMRATIENRRIIRAPLLDALAALVEGRA